MPLHGKSPTLFLTFFAITGQILIMIKSLTNPITYATRIPEIREFVQGLLNRCAPQSTIDRRRREKVSRMSDYVGGANSTISAQPPPSHRRSSNPNDNGTSKLYDDETQPLTASTSRSKQPAYDTASTSMVTASKV